MAQEKNSEALTSLKKAVEIDPNYEIAKKAIEDMIHSVFWVMMPCSGQAHPMAAAGLGKFDSIAGMILLVFRMPAILVVEVFDG